jgi:formylglycine-generating enzyme required for sulfatase activity
VKTQTDPPTPLNGEPGERNVGRARHGDLETATENTKLLVRRFHEPDIMKSVAVSLCLLVVIGDAETQDSSIFAPTIPSKKPAPGPVPQDMVWIPGGEFSMGAAVNGEGSHEMPMASTRGEHRYKSPRLSLC